jgi:hypothetical protein
MANQSARDLAGASATADDEHEATPARRNVVWWSLLREAGTELRLLTGARAFLGILAALLAVDAALVLLHVLHELQDMGVIDGGAWLHSRSLLLSEERGYGEIWGYAKALAATAGLLALCWRSRAPVFGALAFTFALIVLDDSLMIHEVFGHRLATGLALDPSFGLRAQDLGELSVWAMLGVAVVAALAVGFRCSNRRARATAAIFFGLLAALVFVAVGIDMLNIALHDAFPGAHRLWPLAEEGGELVVLSLTCAAAVRPPDRRQGR